MRIAFWIGLFSLVVACKQGEKVVKEMENGMTEIYYQKSNERLKDGEYFMLHPNGQLFMKAYYKNDKLEGRVSYFDTSGNKEIVEVYHKGLLSGEYKMFYPSGSLKAKGTYVQNAMTGSWKFYYPNGQLKENVQYQDNYENGPFIEFYKNGNLKAKGNYIQGDNEHGPLYLYDTLGMMQRIMECDAGKCKTVWTVDSTFEYQTKYD